MEEVPAPGRRHALRVASAVALGVGVPGLALAATPAGSLRLDLFPVVPPVLLQRLWTPLVELLGQAGLPCQLTIHASYAAFEANFLRGQSDLVYASPYHMVMAHRAQGYVPLLRNQDPIQGLLVVRADGPIRELRQLQGQRLSFPAPNALASSLYIRSHLHRVHRLEFETRYASSHRNTIRQVLAEDSVAGGVALDVLNLERDEVRRALRVIYSTPDLPPPPLACHPRVPEAVRSRLVATIIDLAKQTGHRNLFASLRLSDPVPAIYQRDYAPLARLGLDAYTSGS